MRLTIIILLLIALNSESVSQNLFADLNLEKTVAGNHIGAAIIIQAKSKWSLGAFYQIKLSQTPENVQEKDLFYGIMMLMPMMRSEKMNFFINVRAGIVNTNFAVLIPGLETQLRISNRIFTSFGLGMRMGYPAISARIAYKFQTN